MDASPRLSLGFAFVAACVLAFPSGVRADVVVDVNQSDRVRLRFEKIPVLIDDTRSTVTLALDLNFPGLAGPWRGIEFSALTPSGSGYRASAISGTDGRIAVADFALQDATFNPLASLPISGELVLAQSWISETGLIPGEDGAAPISYVWNVNQSVGAGFGMFGTLEAFVVPEPSVGRLLILGMILRGWARVSSRKHDRGR